MSPELSRSAAAAPREDDRAAKGHATQGTPPRAIWLLLGLLFGLLCLVRISSMPFDDDLNYLAYVGTPPTAQAKAIEAGLERRFASLPNCKHVAFRLTFRDKYASNYIGYAALNSTVYWSARSAGQQRENALINSMLITKALAFALVAGLLLLVSAGTRDIQLNTAIAFALLLSAISEVVAGSGLVPTFGIINIGSASKAILELVYSFIVIPPAHSLFGITPRNVASAIFAVALVLRWRGRSVGAAWAILAIGLVHQTYAGLALFFYAIATSLSDPRALRPMSVRFALVLAALIYAWRETYVLNLGSLALPAGIGIVVVAAASFRIVDSAEYHRHLSRELGHLAGRPVLIDALVIVALCTLISLLALVASQGADPISRHYVWADLATRVWAFARFPGFVAIALVVARLWPQPTQVVSTVMMTMAMLAILAAALEVQRNPVRRLEHAQAALLADAAGGKVVTFPSGEVWLYAHLTAISANEESGAGFARKLRSSSLRCVDWLPR
jgi:hypothetical protein